MSDLTSDYIEAQWRLGISTEGWTDLATELLIRDTGKTEFAMVLHYDCPGGGMRAACGESLLFRASFVDSIAATAKPYVCTVCLHAWREAR